MEPRRHACTACSRTEGQEYLARLGVVFRPDHGNHGFYYQSSTKAVSTGLNPQRHAGNYYDDSSPDNNPEAVFDLLVTGCGGAERTLPSCPGHWDDLTLPSVAEVFGLDAEAASQDQDSMALHAHQDSILRTHTDTTLVKRVSFKDTRLPSPEVIEQPDTPRSVGSTMDTGGHTKTSGPCTAHRKLSGPPATAFTDSSRLPAHSQDKAKKFRLPTFIKARKQPESQDDIILAFDETSSKDCIASCQPQMDKSSEVPISRQSSEGNSYPRSVTNDTGRLTGMSGVHTFPRSARRTAPRTTDLQSHFEGKTPAKTDLPKSLTLQTTCTQTDVRGQQPSPQSKTSVDNCTQNGASPFKYSSLILEAAHKGDLAKLLPLLTSSAAPVKLSQDRDSQGNSALHLAAQAGHLGCVQHLWQVSPGLADIENKAKMTPAAVAIQHGRVEVLEWLVTKDASLLHSSNGRKSLIHLAAKLGQDGCMRLILQKMAQNGLHGNLIDGHGNTPAHVAAQYGHLLCLQSLVEYGVDVTQKNHRGYTPCFYADFSNHSSCVAFLVLAHTCLHLAVRMLQLQGAAPSLSCDTSMNSTLSHQAWQIIREKVQEASEQLLVYRTRPKDVNMNVCVDLPDTYRLSKDASRSKNTKARSNSTATHTVKNKNTLLCETNEYSDSGSTHLNPSEFSPKVLSGKNYANNGGINGKANRSPRQGDTGPASNVETSQNKDDSMAANVGTESQEIACTSRHRLLDTSQDMDCFYTGQPVQAMCITGIPNHIALAKVESNGRPAMANHNAPLSPSSKSSVIQDTFPHASTSPRCNVGDMSKTKDLTSGHQDMISNSSVQGPSEAVCRRQNRTNLENETNQSVITDKAVFLKPVREHQNKELSNVGKDTKDNDLKDVTSEIEKLDVSKYKMVRAYSVDTAQAQTMEQQKEWSDKMSSTQGSSSFDRLSFRRAMNMSSDTEQSGKELDSEEIGAWRRSASVQESSSSTKKKKSPYKNMNGSMTLDGRRSRMGSRLQIQHTPVKLQLSNDDFRETYSRKKAIESPSYKLQYNSLVEPLAGVQAIADPGSIVAIRTNNIKGQNNGTSGSETTNRHPYVAMKSFAQLSTDANDSVYGTIEMV